MFRFDSGILHCVQFKLALNRFVKSDIINFSNFKFKFLLFDNTACPPLLTCQLSLVTHCFVLLCVRERSQTKSMQCHLVWYDPDHVMLLNELKIENNFNSLLLWFVVFIVFLDILLATAVDYLYITKLPQFRCR